MAVTRAAMYSETLVPTQTLSNMLRPNSSVPNQYPESEGVSYCSVRFCPTDVYDVSQGPATARTRTRMMTPPAATAMRFCFSLRQASPQKPTGEPVIFSASSALLCTGSKRSGVNVICLLLVSIYATLYARPRVCGDLLSHWDNR